MCHASTLQRTLWTTTTKDDAVEDDEDARTTITLNGITLSSSNWMGQLDGSSKIGGSFHTKLVVLVANLDSSEDRGNDNEDSNITKNAPVVPPHPRDKRLWIPTTNDKQGDHENTTS